uniref:Pentatricopeptide repeat-containing protein At3g09040, mitochondrial n=1 Tax=Anthurium amnicola TaxID=1678845 RepID=A0A1D1Y304_9ARAE
MKRAGLLGWSSARRLSSFTRNSCRRDHYASPVYAVPGKDTIAFANALAFASRCLFLGNQIHGQAIKLGFSRDTFTQNNLLVMYSKCEDLTSAIKLFEEMTEKNLVSWTAIISGSIHNYEYELGLEIFLEMTRTGLRPNEFSLASVLSACAPLRAVNIGICLHSIILKMGMDANSFVGSSLLYMYATFQNIEMAENVFKCVRHPDIACWNTMVEGYILNDYGHDAMRMVSLMHWEGLLGDEFTFTSSLKGCSTSADLNYGRQIHGVVIHHQLEFSTMVMNSLISMYFRMGMKDSAVKVFSRTCQKDIVSWNTMMSAFAEFENDRESLNLFCIMLSTGLKPNQVTFSVAFRLCGAKDNKSLGLQFLSYGFQLGFTNDSLVVNSLIDMFCKWGQIEDAHYLFSRLPTKNTVIWNGMIFGYSLNGHTTEAIQLFCTLHGFGIRPDEFTYVNVLSACNEIQYKAIGEQIHTCVTKTGFGSSCFVGCSLINAYSRFALLEDSFKAFQEIRVPDLVSWAAMISVISKQGFSQQALSLLNHLRQVGEKPDDYIICSALNACANIAAFNSSKCIHSYIIKSGFEKCVCIASALVDTYSKCGNIGDSKEVFKNFSGDYDPILFNTMITAYAHHGLVVDAVKVFEKMKLAKLEPSHATFVAVISACSHSGLLAQGQKFFDSISSHHKISPSMDNYACLVDLHARNGYLEKAKEVIETMTFEPCPSIWRSLLSGCRVHGNKEIGVYAAEKILQLLPNNDAAHFLLCKLHAEEDDWANAAKLSGRMLDQRLWKLPGYSFLEM